ncbi:MAG: 5-formyltetrahydrofolate cyclo-ligase [Deltaproteobacteria bacterium]|nr:5-formyltetrahydrofolate cyclo-ligase [Deltaproteobacteria bacterium]
MEKSDLRNKMLKQRLLLSAEAMQEVQACVLEAIKQRSSFFAHKTVALYADFRNEVPTKDLFHYLISIGSNVAYPKDYTIEASSPEGPRDNVSKLHFFEVKELEELKRSSFGLLEPKSFSLEMRPEDIDVFVVPGLVFDKRGYRIGYGAGCYDRFFSKLKTSSLRRKVFFLGLAYDFQILDRIHEEEHDIPVSTILTEKRWLNCQGVH